MSYQIRKLFSFKTIFRSLLLFVILPTFWIFIYKLIYPKLIGHSDKLNKCTNIISVLLLWFCFIVLRIYFTPLRNLQMGSFFEKSKKHFGFVIIYFAVVSILTFLMYFYFLIDLIDNNFYNFLYTIFMVGSSIFVLEHLLRNTNKE